MAIRKQFPDSLIGVIHNGVQTPEQLAVVARLLATTILPPGVVGIVNALSQKVTELDLVGKEGTVPMLQDAYDALGIKPRAIAL